MRPKPLRSGEIVNQQQSTPLFESLPGLWRRLETCNLQFQRRLAQHWLFTIVILLAFYCGSYATLSCFGSFSRIFISGKLRYPGGIGIPDTYVWQPYGMTCSLKEPELAQLFYFPLVSLDRRFWHPDLDWADTDRMALKAGWKIDQMEAQ